MGVFNGNGFSIKNMSNVASYENQNLMLGLFSEGTGVIENLNMVEITFIVDLSSTADSSYRTHYGGLVASASGRLVLDGITIDELSSVSIKNNSSGTSYVGGLVGFSDKIYVYYSINFGDVTATDSTTFVGGISGFIITTSDYEDAYYTSVIKSNNVVVTGKAFGTKITDLTTLNAAFFTDTLGLDQSVWNLTNLDVVNGFYPILIIDTQE